MQLINRFIILGILFLQFGQKIYGQSLADISFGTDSTFEVVTWNLEWFPKNGTVTVDSVSKIIEAMDVDLIGLQEIDDTTICRQMINNLPGYNLFMDDEWFGGLAYVYKTSTINVQDIYKIYDTSPYWNAFPRSPLVIELSFMGEEFVVINNHFKCCGDGILDVGNSSDEEARRFEASTLLKQYIDMNFSSSRVIVIGDLNDIITDNAINNVFQMFLDDPIHYKFADELIASGPSNNWSFPSWPSHLDHILITNEIFNDFANPGSEIQTIKVDDYLNGGWTDYDFYISDHRPLGLKLSVSPTQAGLSEIKPTVSIFPNPTTDNIIIDLTSFEDSIDLYLYDLKGNLVSNESVDSGQKVKLNLDEGAGVYFVVIESKSKRVVNKVIKR